MNQRSQERKLAEREFTCAWKYVRPMPETPADVQRGEIKVKALDLPTAIVEAKKAVFREHGLTAAHVEILTIAEDFL